ncbi:MAG: ABC transporter permease [Opitutales bacterium]|nr:ABC transporter permease [Opitutales bacterium]
MKAGGGDGLLKRRGLEILLTAPSLIWMGLFFALPTFLVFLIAFRPADPWGGVGDGFTLESWARLGNPAYPLIFWRTLWLSAATTVICLVLAVPVAYWLARLDRGLRRWMLILVILPFWTNFLIRIFAWKTLLHPEGYVKELLLFFGFSDAQAQLLYNPWAVLIVLVYSYLPFAILPLYAAAEKFDFSLVEAAWDLGAGRLRAFWSVFVPGISKGLLTAFLIVFVPALGSYAIPDIIGGTSSEMIGNRIAQRVFTDRNLPHASALSALLALAVLLPMVAYLVQLGREQRRLRKEGGAE